MKIVADKNIPYLKGIVENYGEVTYLSGSGFTPDAIKDTDVLIVRTVTHFDEEMLRSSKVKLICTATIGFDHIDTDYCNAHGIVWRNAPGCNARAVQQYILGSLIVLAERYSFDLKEKTIGIVGVGNVGSIVAQSCRLLGMQVLLNDPPRQDREGKGGFVDISQIRDKADIITFHIPLTKDGKYKTHHLVDDSFVSSLTRKPILINSARGSIFNTSVVKQALLDEKIKGVVIDCWENEPNIDLALLKLANIGTQHIAGYSSDGKANASRMSLTSLADFYNMDRTPISQIKEEEPANPIIDLSQFGAGVNRIHQAILATYNPLTDDAILRSTPGTFKDLRNHYNYRREFRAYTVINATSGESEILLGLGFSCK